MAVSVVIPANDALLKHLQGATENCGAEILLLLYSLSEKIQRVLFIRSEQLLLHSFKLEIKLDS